MVKVTTIIFAVYEAESVLRSDTLKFLELVVQNPTIEVVLVYNGVLSNLQNLDDSIVVISNPVQGYDLNCYIRGFLYCRNKNRESFIFMNNSIYITYPRIFLNTLLLIAKKLDFFSFVSFSISREIQTHFQSFLFGINFSSRADLKKRLLEISEEKDIAFTRDEVIQKFELKSHFYVTKMFNLNYDLLFNPGLFLRAKAFFNFLITLGFLDNLTGLYRPNSINYSLFLKNTIERKYGFKKIKSTSVLNKFK